MERIGEKNYQELLASRNFLALRDEFSDLQIQDLAEIIEDFDPKDASLVFRIIQREKAAEVFEYLSIDKQTELVENLADEQLVNVLNTMSPDDRTRLFEELPPEVTKRALTILGPDQLKIARKLLGYPEYSAGRYMTPEYLSLRPDMTVGDALSYIRTNGKDRETLSILYVVDDRGHFIHEINLEALVLADPMKRIREFSENEPTSYSIPASADRSEVIAAFEKYDKVALPVTDSQGYLLGIITIDDVLDVAEEKATEDIQRLGGLEALDAPYLENSFFAIMQKRVGWLAILFVSELFTSTALSYFETELRRWVFLSFFVPLIISSGGNSGSQATSLVIRSLTTRDIELSDWFKILKKELLMGIALGTVLGLIGFLRVIIPSMGQKWLHHHLQFGEHFVIVGVTIGIAVLCVVILGTFCGSMLPFLLKKTGFDPATASAPFVATIVDVSGIVVFFLVARLVMHNVPAMVLTGTPH